MINYTDNKEAGRVAVWLDGERRPVSAIRKGAVNEHIAKAWLLKQGYEVFSNVSPEGPADLVAVKFDAGETLYVDVKSQSFSMASEDGERYLQRSQDYGIRYLVVADDGECRWYDAYEYIQAANDNGYIIRIDEMIKDGLEKHEAKTKIDKFIDSIRYGSFECLVQEGFYREAERSRMWVGVALADKVGVDIKNKSVRHAVRAAIRDLIQSGKLVVVDGRCPLTRYNTRFVRVAKWVKAAA